MWQRTLLAVCYIDRLPNEILWKILLFYGYTTTVAGFQGYYGTRSRINTNRIILVNKHWQAIALAIPSLWSKIYVRVASFSHGPSLEALVDRRIELSKDAPLEICVLFSERTVRWSGDNYEEYSDDSNEDSIEGSEKPQAALPVLAKLFQHAHRWKSAVLQLPASRELDHTKFPDTFPLLQELEMRCLPRNDVGTDHCPAFYAPLLRKFTMEKFSFGGNFGSSKLSEITLTWVLPDTVASFLEHASSDCNAQVFTVFTPHTDYGSTTVTSHLKALSVIQIDDDKYYDVHGELFEYLTLPNVEKLVFIDQRTGRADYVKPHESPSVLFPVEGLLSMLARSEMSLIKLSHLVLSGHFISDQNLLKILTKLPALTFFAFEETCLLNKNSCALTAHFFQGLLSADVVPILTQLELIFYDGTVPVDDLALFLESHRPSLEGKSSTRLLPLERVRFGISSPQTCMALMDRLSELCSGGLVVKVSKPWF
ncbi:hypothetical protein BDP27DRAFT_397108 [Rhodocollybia butyracea]|uniref:F-box domain-containing protein n=1 Tax=Rhodocollybia butyracea TaxID=206335 RepID=A0A9P5Q0J8_9AGAR|nr:hypothetical protein BDP27DRAFT_397108 [Rhodocollybia butyracea]